MERKLSTPMKVLCSAIPTQIQDMLEYVRGLQFEEQPDYNMLMGKLRTIGCENNFNLYDGVYDWLDIAKSKKMKMIERGQIKHSKEGSMDNQTTQH
jgi:hypothetical protein